MSSYLIIESRDPFDSVDTEFTRRTAQELAGKGEQVTVCFIQNGVLPLRKGTKFTAQIDELRKNKIKLWADDFSLKERGIASAEMTDGVEMVSMDTLVKTLVEEKPKAFWH